MAEPSPARLAVLIARDVCNTLGALVMWLWHRDRLAELRPRLSGKVVTSLQFWTIVHVVLGLPYFDLTFAAVGVATIWALLDYGIQFRRVLGASKSVSTP